MKEKKKKCHGMLPSEQSIGVVMHESKSCSYVSDLVTKAQEEVRLG